MEETWKNLAPPFAEYKISNFGRLKNAKNKDCKIALKKDRQYQYPYVNINIRRKSGNARLFRPLAQVVYEAFGENYTKRATVYHKDNNLFNCRLDNLYISRCYMVNPSQEQINIYEKQIKSCVLHLFRVKNWIYANHYGFDIDNCMGDCYLLIYQHLSQFKVGTSFYSFVAKYATMVFKTHYKKFKKTQQMTVRLIEDGRNKIF